MIDFSKNPKATGIGFTKKTDEDQNLDFFVEVHDRYPQMDEMHIEGRRYVEVSVEMFIELVGLAGYAPIVPGTAAVTYEEEDWGDDEV